MIGIVGDLERLSFRRRSGVEKTGGDEIGVGECAGVSYSERRIVYRTSQRSPEIDQLVTAPTSVLEIRKTGQREDELDSAFSVIPQRRLRRDDGLERRLRRAFDRCARARREVEFREYLLLTLLLLRANVGSYGRR